MPYVGTPKPLGSPRDTLASVLEGEGGGTSAAEQAAMANVIANRAATNFNNYGADVVSQATARNQFQGQAKPSQISQRSYDLADQVLGGTLPDNTGGALFYAVPKQSQAPWARNLTADNSVRIGSTYFTDNQFGTPFTNSAPPGTTLNSTPQPRQYGYASVAPMLSPPALFGQNQQAGPDAQPPPWGAING
jgi:hypothetical protein